MRLSELIHGLNCKKIHFSDVEISGINYDSRKVCPGDLFFCITGFKSDGHDYAEVAATLGAVALLVTKELPISIPQILVEDDRKAMAKLSAKFYGYPAKKLKMIGITGTNGKTTTTYMIKAMGESAGKRVGLIGTIVNMIGDKIIKTQHTTPEAPDLHKLLFDMFNDGCEWVVMEVSSHSLHLNRVYGVDFDIGVFTNLTQDHLDYHSSMDDYAAQKKKLLANSKIAIINADDVYYPFMAQGVGAKKYTYAIETPANYRAEEIENTSKGVSYYINDEKITVPIPGIFSVYNSLCSYAAGINLGLSPQVIKDSLFSMEGVSGRFEVLTKNQPYCVILDYSHTPDSLQNALTTARQFTQGKLICLFGCGGDRDNAKRPIMGRISGELADISIVTSDNPRSEEPKKIIEQILVGVQETSGEYVVIEDRREAIEYAIRIAREGDTVLLAGKGHETYQEINGVKFDFDEKQITREIQERVK